jgi:hypothetical protein
MEPKQVSKAISLSSEPTVALLALHDDLIDIRTNTRSKTGGREHD